MKLLSRPSAAATTLVALALLAVLSPGCGSRGVEPPTGTATTPWTIVCGSFPVHNTDGTVEYEPEYFILGAMNRKLKNFPDFARYVGTDQVDTCEGARVFYNAYLRYLHMHPGFDDHQPIESHPPLPSFIPPEAYKQKPAEVPKILNGQPSNVFPVVHLQYSVLPGVKYFDNSVADDGRAGPPPLACTGFFIAKNWIVTAAHCIRNIALQGGSDRIFNNTWLNAYDGWQIDWPDSDGNVQCPAGSFHFGGGSACTPGQTAKWLVSIVDQNYVGVVNPDHLDAAHNPSSPPHDVALIYIYDLFYDGFLPPVMNLPDGSSAAFAIPTSTADVNPNWTLTAYGYGATSGQFPGAGGQLTSGTLSSPVILEGPSAGVGSDIFDIGLGDVIATNIGTSGDVGVCLGDSGGPLVRTATDGTLVAVGVASSFFSSDSSGMCSDNADDQFWYARMDAEADWILQEMQTQYSSKFQCVPSDDGTYERCANALPTKGGDCATNCDCPNPATYCRNSAVLDPNSPFGPDGPDTCTSCGDGTCNCIRGQCLPRPDDFDGGDMNGDASCTSM